jgi:hypothetical protein
VGTLRTLAFTRFHYGIATGVNSGNHLGYHMGEETIWRSLAYEEQFPHREAKNEMYTEEVPDCASCNRSPEAAYQIGYWQDIVRIDDKAHRRLRLTKWMFWCLRCLGDGRLAPHWWGRAICGDVLEAEEE